MTSRRDLSIGQRLFTGTSVIALLIVVLGGAMALSVSRIRGLQRDQAEVLQPRVAAAHDLEVAVLQQGIAFRNYVITRSATSLEAFRRSEAEVDHRIQRVETLSEGPESRRFLLEIQPVLAEHRKAFQALLALQRAEAIPEQLQVAETHVTAHRNDLLARVRAFADLQLTKNEAAAKQIGESTEDLRNAVIVVTILIFVASFVKTFIVGRAVREPAARIIDAAEAMRSGSFGPALALQEERLAGAKPFRDELREAAHAFGRMAAVLDQRERRLAAHSRLSGALGTTLDPAELARHALSEVSQYLGTEVGAVYVMNAEGVNLHAIATLALGDVSTLSLGEGLPGQVVLERKTRIVREIPPDTPFVVRFGVDQAVPRCIIASPMVVKSHVVGAIVFASLRDIDEAAVGFVELAAAQLAVTLDNAMAHARIAGLATELQKNNEVLQSQNEELQAQSEELQVQSEELQSQNEELQAQSEELQIQADELHLQAAELRARQQALELANDALAHAEEQKNHFLAVLGHELRNPLAAITGAVALLGGGDDDGRTREIVRQQTAHLASLLDDLLDIGRITSGKIVLSQRPLELGAAAERCAGLLTRTGNGGPSLSVEVDQPVWIHADATRIEQIVTNLLTNAIKFTPPDGRIAVRVGSDGEAAVLRVTDTGVGIDAALLPKIFDFFVQGPARPGKNGGLGIGLTLVKKLTELHGGTVEATSSGAGQGTTFTLRFPAVQPPMRTSTASSSPRIPIKRSIVVVEDNADIRQMMQLWLTRAGHRVAEAHDGPSGVEVVTEARPDIALIDLDLPGFDGCEVARRLRSNPAVNGVRLIAVSGYGRPEDRARALDAGFDDLYVKPLDLERLSSLLSDSVGEG